MEPEFVHCNTGGSRRRPGGQVGAGGRGGVTLGWRPEHSVHSSVVTEMMAGQWAVTRSARLKWRGGHNIVKYRRIRRPGWAQL